MYQPPKARPASNTPWFLLVVALLLALVADAGYSRYQQYQFRQQMESSAQRFDAEMAKMRAAFDQSGEVSRRAMKEVGSKAAK